MREIVTISAVVNHQLVETRMRVVKLDGRYRLPVDFLPFDLPANRLSINGRLVIQGSCYEDLSRPTIVEVY